MFVYSDYTTDQDTKAEIESYTSMAVGGNTQINYADSTWTYTNENDSSETLTIKILKTSYTVVNNIEQIEGEACSSSCGSDGSSSVNYSTTDGDMVYSNDITINLDMEFEFSEGYTFYASTSWAPGDLDSDDLYSLSEIQNNNVDCEKKLSGEFVFPLQTSDGTYVSADSSTYSGYAELRLEIVDGQDSPLFIVCGVE